MEMASADKQAEEIVKEWEEDDDRHAPTDRDWETVASLPTDLLW